MVDVPKNQTKQNKGAGTSLDVHRYICFLNSSLCGHSGIGEFISHSLLMVIYLFVNGKRT